MEYLRKGKTKISDKAKTVIICCVISAALIGGGIFFIVTDNHESAYRISVRGLDFLGINGSGTFLGIVFIVLGIGTLAVMVHMLRNN